MAWHQGTPMKKFISWEVAAIALCCLLGSACVGLVSVVWGQQTEIATQKERVDGLRSDIADLKATIEKKLDRIEAKMDLHLTGDK